MPLESSGVRIGTAEINRVVEALPEVGDSLVIGQEWEGNERVANNKPGSDAMDLLSPWIMFLGAVALLLLLVALYDICQRNSSILITLRVYAHLLPRDLRPVFLPKVVVTAGKAR